MSIIKPPVLPAWADGGDKVQPSNLEISAGWPSSSIPPSRQRFNWILNYVANAARYFSRRGIVDYDVLETYQTDDVVRGDNGLLYRSLVDNNTANAPSTSTTDWGSLRTVTPSISDKSTSIATTKFASDYVDNAIASIASLAAASSSEISSGAAVNKFIRPDLLVNAFNSLKAPSGYQRLPSGLLVQWGIYSVSSTPISSNYPIAFAATPFVTLVSPLAGWAQYPSGVTANNAASFTFTNTTTSGGAASFAMLAIGY